MATTKTGVTESEQSRPSGKKSKPKGVGHEMRTDILVNDNIKVELGWEEVNTEYWDSKLFKKYVNMYHIGRL